MTETEPGAGSRRIFTIGHSTHGAHRFLRLLSGHAVACVADVRRYPASRRQPQFNAESLAEALAEAGIAYLGLGAELGGRRRVRPGSANDGWRVQGFRAYADHMDTAGFAAGMARLEELATESLTAVMCAEGDWRRCHRQLIADALVVAGWRVRHILPDGSLDDHRLTAVALVEGERITYPGPQGRLA
jgi:uncharacterized protein (DUF488 family)